MTTATKTNRRNASCVFNRIANARGRFFGLYLTNGEAINAQYRDQTDSYLVIFDRFKNKNRRILKSRVIDATV